MADVKKLTSLEQLELLAQRTKDEQDKLSGRIDQIVSTGGEPNVITSIKVNGAAQNVAEDKSVDIKVPTKVSDLNNDQEFQTASDVTAAVDAAINKFATDVSDDDTVNTYKELVDYAAKHKGEAATFAGDIKKNADAISALQTDVAGKVDSIPGKQLSTEDFTTALKEKLNGLNNYEHPAAEAHASGFYKVTVDGTGHVTAVSNVTKQDITALDIPGQDTTYQPVTAGGEAGLMSGADKTKLDGITVAENSEVTSMLNTVFGAD